MTNVESGAASGGSARVVRRLLVIAIAAFIVAHLVQVVTPLRLDTDAIYLLRMAVSFQEGHGWRPPGTDRPQPIGFPALVVGLDKLGIASSTTFVAANIMFLLVGLWANFRLLRTLFPSLPGGDTTRFAIVMLTLASWVIIKHTPIALSDMTYFGVSALAAWTLSVSWNGRTGGASADAEVSGRARVLFLLAGFTLVGASLMTRTVGVAFLPAALLAAVGPEDRLHRLVMAVWRRSRKGVMIGILGCIIVGAVGAAVVVTRTKYGREAIDIYTHDSPVKVALDILRYRLSDLGYLIFNINENSVPGKLRFVVYLAGAVGYLALFAGFWRSWRAFGPALVYLAAYTAIVLVWPYTDPRFWIPVIPLSAGLVVEGVRPLWNTRGARVLAVVYIVCFTLLGAAAMAYTTRISLAGERFGSAFGDGQTLKDSYLKALGLPHDESKVLPEVLKLYERYEVRARGR